MTSQHPAPGFDPYAGFGAQAAPRPAAHAPQPGPASAYGQPMAHSQAPYGQAPYGQAPAYGQATAYGQMPVAAPGELVAQSRRTARRAMLCSILDLAVTALAIVVGYLVAQLPLGSVILAPLGFLRLACEVCALVFAILAVRRRPMHQLAPIALGLAIGGLVS